LNLRYEHRSGARELAAGISCAMRDAAYEASVELAREKGPLSTVRCPALTWPGPTAPRGLPEPPAGQDPTVRRTQFTPFVDRAHRNHIARVCQATPRAASSRPLPGPMFARSGCPMAPGRITSSRDYAFRLYKHMGGNPSELPPAFRRPRWRCVAVDHMLMIAAVQPYIDAGGQQDRERAGRLPVRRFSATCICRRGRRGLKGHHHVSAPTR